jgi:hypothetical protein
VQPSAAVAITVTLADSTLMNGNLATGFLARTPVAGSTINATITRVTASGNSSGFVADSMSLGTITIVIADAIAAENAGVGVYISGANATAIVSGSSLVRNWGVDLLQAESAVLRTAGNNAVTGRGAADIQGTLTPNPLK